MFASGLRRTSQQRFAAALLVAAIVALQAAHTRGVAFQGCSPSTCVSTTHNVEPPTLDVYLTSAGFCKVDGVDADEGLMENDVSVRSALQNIIHGGRSSTVGQYCLYRGCSGPNCITYPPENRSVSTIGLRQVPPSGGSGTYFPLMNDNTPPYLAIIDSNSGLTNGPNPWTANTTGTFTYKTNVLTWATRCNIQPTTHPETVNTVNVMACKPEWLLDDSINPHGPQNATLNVPLGMEDVLEEALAAANSMTSLGLGFSVNLTYAQTCIVGSCINMAEDLISSDCAQFEGGSTSGSGVYLTPNRIRLWAPTPSGPNWRTSHPQRLQVLIAHELLHYFGLDDRLNSTCTGSNTIMGPEPPPGCNSPTAPPTGTLLGPSWSDGATVRSGSYGPQNRKQCGW